MLEREPATSNTDFGFMEIHRFLRVSPASMHWALPLRLQRSAFTEVKKAYHYSEHRHTNYEVIICVSGSYQGWVNGKAVLLKPGQGLLILPGDLHRDQCLKRTSFYSLGIEQAPERTPTEMQDLFIKTGSVADQCFAFEGEQIKAILAGLMEESQVSDACSLRIQDALLEAFVWHIIRRLPQALLAPTLIELNHQEDFIQQLSKLMQDSLGQPISVREMAEALHMSERQLNRKCQTFFQKTPSALFREFRMRQAQELLQKQDLSVQEIAWRIGFQDPFHFSRTFRKMFGVSPKEYRASGVETQG